MKCKYIICALLWAMSLATSLRAEGEKQRVDEGITAVDRLIEARQWHEAFLKLRQVETTDATTADLRYITTKKRYQMYDRLHKNGDAQDCLARMEQLAKSTGDAATLEDMLLTKADYNYKQGNVQVSKDCYLQIFDARVQGQDDAGRDQCYQTLIAEARSKDYKGMELVITDLYNAWQDSISAVHAAQEIILLKDSCANAQAEIAERKSTISHQYTFIIVLALIIAGAAVGLVVLFFMLVRGRSVNKKLTNQLEVSQTNSQQKSLFIRNIGKQISPSLTQIASGNAQQHIGALQNMLADVERFLAIEEDKASTFETASQDVSKLCEELCAAYSGRKVSVTTDATKLQFPVHADTVKLILTGLIDESMACADTERIVLSFKKRNPHTGQFIVTANGMRLDPEQDPASLFVPFARVYDLTVSSGLGLPICALLTSKLGGSIAIDTTFTKGTRFVVDVHC